MLNEFWFGLKFAVNIYILATFITLLVLGVMNIIKKITGKKATDTP